MESMVRVGADEVWVEDTGGDGPPVVLLHEGVGDSRIWDPVLPLLNDYRVVRYDCRGYGRSPASTQRYTLLDDAVAVLDATGLDRATLVGCSMGGGTSLALAVTKPERVAGLVLLCPGIPGFQWPPNAEMEALGEAAEETGDLEPLIQYSLKVWAAGGVDQTVTTLMRGAARAWVSEDGHCAEDPPVFDRLAEVRVPAALLVGDLDRAPLIESNEEAARRIPDCRLVRLPGVDHYPSLRVPETVAEAIRSIGPTP